MGNFKLSKGTLESPRCNYSTKQSYQGVAKIKGMSDAEARNIDEHDNAIPKEEKKKKKEIPVISMDNNLQTATGGTRFSKPAASKRLREYDPEVGKKPRTKTAKASAGKKTPEKLPPTKEEQPQTQDVDKKEEEDNKPKPINIKKPETQSLETKFRELKAKFGGKIKRILGEPNDPPKKLKNTGYTGQ